MGVGSLVRQTLRRLVPPVFGTRFLSLLDALAVSIESARAFIASSIHESNPGTSDDLLRDWYVALGINYDETQSLKTRQLIARQFYAGSGGQALIPLNESVQRVFPNVEIVQIRRSPENNTGFGVTGQAVTSTYPPWWPISFQDGSPAAGAYLVRGSVQRAGERAQLLALLGRLAPAEMEPVLTVTVDELATVARTGIAITGFSQTGWEPQAIAGVTGKALTGLGVTGRGAE